MDVSRTDRRTRSAVLVAVLALPALVAVSCSDDSSTDTQLGGSSPEETTEQAAEALYRGSRSTTSC